MTFASRSQSPTHSSQGSESDADPYVCFESEEELDLDEIRLCWQAVMDNGITYYYNTLTQQKTYAVPDGYTPEDDCMSDQLESGCPYWTDTDSRVDYGGFVSPVNY